MASSNLKHTTFAEGKKEVVTEMVVSPAAAGSQTPTSRVIGKQISPLINTDDTDRKPAASTQQSAVSRKRLPKLPAVPRSPELGKQSLNTHPGDAQALRKTESAVG
jgi:hypothetical protein